MKYIIEILDKYENNKVIETKRTYTIEELKKFYQKEYANYPYRVYEGVEIDLWN